MEQLRTIKKHWPCLSNTMEYRISKIVPHGHSEEKKDTAVLRDSAARNRISIPMCNKAPRVAAPAHTSQVDHHKESSSGYT